jgi:5'-nucleotidase
MFLLTNDDGISAPGLWAAARALRTLGEVMVVAPSANQSGQGTSLPPQRELNIYPYPHKPADLQDVTAFSLPASPAACVQVGLSGALTARTIHVVVSGVNDTYNLGRDVIYSGTVGGALTAHLRGLPALAASFGDGTVDGAHWETATWAVQEIVRTMLDSATLTPPLINLNIPNLPLSQIAGVEITSLSTRTLLDRYYIALSEPNLLRLSPLVNAPEPNVEPNSDAWAVEHGSISITPLQLFPDLLCVTPWGGSMVFPTRRVFPDGAWSVMADAR